MFIRLVIGHAPLLMSLHSCQRLHIQQYYLQRKKEVSMALVECARLQKCQVAEVRVCRDSGETVHFNGGKVIVNLHFKQVPK